MAEQLSGGEHGVELLRALLLLLLRQGSCPPELHPSVSSSFLPPLINTVREAGIIHQRCGVRTCGLATWGLPPQRSETNPRQDSASRWHHVRREPFPARGGVWGAGRRGWGGVGSGLRHRVQWEWDLSDFQASLPGTVGPALPGKGPKGPSRTYGPEWAGAEEGVLSTTDNPTLEGG